MKFLGFLQTRPLSLQVRFPSRDSLACLSLSQQETFHQQTFVCEEDANRTFCRMLQDLGSLFGSYKSVFAYALLSYV